MYYLAINGQQQGPYTVDQVAAMIREGKVNATTLAFTRGMATWTPIAHIPELRAYVTPSGTGF